MATTLPMVGPPFAIKGDGAGGVLVTAEAARQVLAAATYERSGIVNGLGVRAQAVPTMDVDVTAGLAIVPINSSVGQGQIPARLKSDGSVTIGAADVTNPRVDRVVVEVLATELDAGTDNEVQVRVVAGTPAASPTAPAEPNNAVTIALVTVPVSATEITTADIDVTGLDQAPAGEAQITAGQSLPATGFEGETYFDRTTSTLWRWIGFSGGAWRPWRGGLCVLSAADDTISSGSQQAIQFGTSDYDPHNWKSSNDAILPGVTGWYRVTLGLTHAASGFVAADTFVLAITRNGGFVGPGLTLKTTATTPNPGLFITGLVEITSTSQKIGGLVNFTNASAQRNFATHLSAEWIAPN